MPQASDTRSDSFTFLRIPVGTLIPEYVRRAWQAGSSTALREFETALRKAGSPA